MEYKIRYVETICYTVSIEAESPALAEEELNTLLLDDTMYAIDNGEVDDKYPADWFTEIVQ